MNRISANKASVYTAHANPEHSADSDHLWSDSLDVTFDLGVNDWDDFDDGNLVEASEVCCNSKSCDLMTDHGQPSNAGLLGSFYSLLFAIFNVSLDVRSWSNSLILNTKRLCGFFVHEEVWLQPHNVQPKPYKELQVLSCHKGNPLFIQMCFSTTCIDIVGHFSNHPESHPLPTD